MKAKNEHGGKREEDYHPYITAIERGDIEPTLSEVMKMGEVLGIDPAVIVTPRNIPDERLEFLSDFIKYLEGEPKHLLTIQMLVIDAMEGMNLGEWARPVMVKDRKRMSRRRA
jgi:hypothetical protein